jgi:hypothetical protein
MICTPRTSHRDIFVGTMRIAHSNPRLDVNSLFAADLEAAPVPQGPVYHVFQEPWLNPATANNA